MLLLRRPRGLVPRWEWLVGPRYPTLVALSGEGMSDIVRDKVLLLRLVEGAVDARTERWTLRRVVTLRRGRRTRRLKSSPAWSLLGLILSGRRGGGGGGRGTESCIWCVDDLVSLSAAAASARMANCPLLSPSDSIS